MFWFGKRATLYLHFPCFDGTISAVLTTLYLQQARGWKFKKFQPVNYHQQNEWLDTPLARRNAVVDFLYHPQAVFWADHHSTTFLKELLRTNYEARSSPGLIYDSQSGSCASLLWKRIGAMFSGDQRLQEMVQWAEKIDSAGYESVQEAMSNSHPALVLSRSMACDADEAYCNFLVTRLLREPLADVVKTEEVQRRFRKVAELNEAGLKRVKDVLRLEGSVAVYEVDSKGIMINRYAPYYFYPEALYSVAVTHSKYGAKITAMRNPWREFESINLGEFMRKFGGGGHQRVGSLVLSKEREQECAGVVESLLRELLANKTQPATNL